MVQGKFKKAKVPAAVQKKQKQSKRSVAFTRRQNAPIQAKKGKFTEQQKIKQVISKSVNKSVESELRARAKEGNISLSRAQQAVAKHHQSMGSTPASASTSSEAASETKKLAAP